MLRSITRSFALAFVTTSAGATAAAAQHPSGNTHGGPQPEHTAMVGMWAGTFQLTSQGNGGMELLVARDSLYRVKMQLTVDHPFPPVELREFTVDGKTVTWVNDLMGTTCKATATLDDAGTMKGAMACDARTLTFSVAKKK